MGTNYYVRTPACDKACEHCNETKLVHLGKSSAGWKFTLRAYEGWRIGNPDNPIDSWLELANSGAIEDEYGQFCTLRELLALIMSKQTGARHNNPSKAIYEGEGNPGIFDYGGFDFCDREFS